MHKRHYHPSKVGYELIIDLKVDKSEKLQPYKIKKFLEDFFSYFKNEITLVKDFFHIFQNKHFHIDGVSYISVLKESHLAIHTYPEIKLISINVYFCKKNVYLFKEIKKYILIYFNAKDFNYRIIKRGIQQNNKKYSFIKKKI